MTNFILNNSEININHSVGTALLEIIRGEIKLMGTKAGCGEGDCGACTVLLGELNKKDIKYLAVNSCISPLGQMEGKHIVTIEGLNKKELTLIQAAFCKEFAAQCGFCTPGFIISLTGFLLNAPRLDEDEAIAAIAGNICRCTGYTSIRRALSGLLSNFNRKEFEKTKGLSRVELLIKKNVLPKYFKNIPSLLEKLKNKQNTPEDKKINSSFFVAGATDLMAQKKEEMAAADLNFLFPKKNNSKTISETGGQCFVSAAATMEEIRNSNIMKKIFPGIKNALNLVASAPVRNRATIAGNFVNASPIGDLTVLFLILDSTLILSDGKKKREIKLRNFYKGYKKLNKKEGEIVEMIYFTIPKGYLINFEKVSKREYLDIASVNSTIAIRVEKDKIKDIRLSAGGVGPIPVYLAKTCGFLKGKKLSVENISRAAKIIRSEISPISDLRGSKPYKSLLLERLVCAHFIKLFPKKFGKNIL